MITVLGVITVVVVAATWLFKREWMQFVIGATVAFPQTAGLLVLGSGFPLFYLAALVMTVLSTPYLLAGLARPGAVAAIANRPRGLPDRIAVILVAWAALIGYAGPRIFAGMRVFAPELGVDAQINNMAQLAPSLGNVAQFGYLAFAVIFLLLAGRLFVVDSRLLGTTLWTAISLAAVRIVAEPVWPHELLQNMPSFNYATAERLSGTFYEPSVLGLYLVAAAGFFAARLFRHGWRGRVPAMLALSITAVDFVANGSGTALLGLVILAAVAAGAGLIRQAISATTRVRPWLVVAGTLTLGVGLTQLPLLFEYTVGSLADKVGSGSFIARNASNLRAWQIFTESLGLGVGLGSNRPSSLFFLVLGCLGLIGVVLLGALVVIALARSLSGPVRSAAGWGLAGVVIAAVVAVPDLSSPVLWVALAACFANAPPDPGGQEADSTAPLAEFLPRSPR